MLNQIISEEKRADVQEMAAIFTALPQRDRERIFYIMEGMRLAQAIGEEKRAV